MSHSALIRPLCRSLTLWLLVFILPQPAAAMPAFARQYNISCNTCHAAFPRLNAFGEHFVASNYRLPNWKESNTQDVDDPLLALPKSVPLAIRAQAYVQNRSAKVIDVSTGVETANARTDIQAPYLIKLLSSAPLSEHLTYYFYGIFAEKGGNGEAVIEDAWFRHDDVFDTGAGMMLGQFQVSDLMFPRETRLTFQDFMVYRMAGITYDRGLVLDRGFGPLDVALGVVNGNGISSNYTINSPGYQRPDHLFDNDNRKSVFGRFGFEVGPINVGLFGLAGSQSSVTGVAGMDSGSRTTDKRVSGLDLSGEVGGRTYWFAQALWNQWDGFLDASPDRDYKWVGGFAGVDHVADERWVYSALYNYVDAKDFKESDTIYEGIDMNSLTLAVSYYFMRNAKGVIEVNYDLLKKKGQSGSYWTGHLTNEHYILLGFDAAF